MRYLIFLFIFTLSLFAQSERPCNPALLLQGQQPEVTLLSEITTEGRAKNLSGKISVPLGLFQSVGLSASDQFKRSGLDGTVIRGHYAINPFATFDFGASVSYLTYRDSYRHHNGTMSLGMNYRFPLHPIAGEHHLGLSGRNLFAVPHEAVPDLIDPASIMLGWNGMVWDQRLQFSADIGADILDKSLLYRTKFEFRPSIFTIGVEKSTDAWNVSAGVSLLNTDVFVSYNEYESDKRVGIILTRGIMRGRESGYAYKMSPCFCTPPSELWRKALRAYNENMPYRAMAILGKIITEMPEFHKNDSARILIVKSMLHLGFNDAPRQLIDSILFYPFSDSLLRSVRALEFETAVIGNSNEAPYLYRALKSLGTDEGLSSNVEYLMGQYFLYRGENEKAIEHFLLVGMDSELYKDAQRELRVAQFLHKTKKCFIVPDNELISLYKKLMREHEEIGQKVLELLSTHETSYTIMELSEIEKQINQNLVLIEQYKQAVENEKNRILKLVEESQ